MINLYEKISIEEVIDEMSDTEWTKYIASLCKNCGAVPDEFHLCNQEFKEKVNGK